MENIQIDIVRKNVKNINMKIYPPDGRVKISVPKRIKNKDIHKFISKHMSWIEKTRQKILNQKIEPKLTYTNGETHYFMGEKYTLNLNKGKKSYVELGDNFCINMFINGNVTYENREKLLDEWYRAGLKKEISKIIEKWEKITKLKVNKFGVKKMKTRWGTCNIKAKRIWLNLELAKKNRECLEYIVLHEMVHLLERLHNDNFKNYMDIFMPEWRKIEEKHFKK